MNLLDNAFIKGCLYDDFIQTIKSWDNDTSAITVNTKDISIYGIYSSYDKEKAALMQINDSAMSVNLKSFSTKQLPDEQLTEEAMDNNFIIVINGNIFYTGINCLRDLCARCGISGEILIDNKYSLIRNTLLNTVLKNSEKDVTLIIRKDGDLKKIVAVPSKKYYYIKQSFLNNIIKYVSTYLGSSNSISWEVCHNYTKIVCDFPDKINEIKTAYKIDAIPQLEFHTSDTGDSSMGIIAFLKMGNITFLVDKCNKKHSGLELENFENNIKKKIFPKLEYVPKRLADLSLISMDKHAAKICIEEIFFEFKKLISPKKINIIENLLKDELVYDQYSAYDIFFMIESLQDRLDDKFSRVKEIIKNNTFLILDYKYEKIISDEKITLYPA